jgi:dolichol-phosphate mannosyltransferase
MMKPSKLVVAENGPAVWEMPKPADGTVQPRRTLLPFPGPELSIIVPTFNERENVGELIRRLDETLMGCSWEVIFVDDDSPDGTCRLVREMAQNDYRIRCVQRIGRRGLSSACIEGMLASSAPYLAVIDGDLQHDETLLLPMLHSLKNTGNDVVVGRLGLVSCPNEPFRDMV